MMKFANVIGPIPVVVLLVSAQPVLVSAQPSAPAFSPEARFIVAVAKDARQEFTDTLDTFNLKLRKNGNCKPDETNSGTQPNFPRSKVGKDGVEYVRLFYLCQKPNETTYNAFAQASEAAAEVLISTSDGKMKRKAVRIVLDTYDANRGAGTCQKRVCSATGDVDDYIDSG